MDACTSERYPTSCSIPKIYCSTPVYPGSFSVILCTGDVPTPRRSHGCTLVGDTMYVHGGFDGLNHFNDLYGFDVVRKVWIKPHTKVWKSSGTKIERMLRTIDPMAEYMSLVEYLEVKGTAVSTHFSSWYSPTDILL